MISSSYFSVIFLTLVSMALCQNSANSSNSQNPPNIVCQLCTSGLYLVQSQLLVLENEVKNNLKPFITNVCQSAPTGIPIVKALCDVLKDDLLDAILTLINGIREQADPNTVCKYIRNCGSDNNEDNKKYYL
ncbi:Saposin B-type domain-containing protein [Caenorhabditis elegans]|uniref:Saposin B-type domain-containing protein n=1 Tax=Caenorhabditis elegans TaxID=6239 RepID=M1ZJW2_CAEEL|nr:Saposin B-type domain-containing protein [Caenorhabditis elegans]CCU83362.1 Saposin B-type domain-containing protein [Caenorhabditis elegans]|eukprot:NP_001294748.1 Uncharacterized protein CELE_K04A8.18 [Caenorhabditis elegans]